MRHGMVIACVIMLTVFYEIESVKPWTPRAPLFGRWHVVPARQPFEHPDRHHGLTRTYRSSFKLSSWLSEIGPLLVVLSFDFLLRDGEVAG